MKKELFIILVSFAFLLMACGNSTAESAAPPASRSAASSPPTQTAAPVVKENGFMTMPLMGGRLYIDMPAGTKDIAVQNSIMSASSSAQKETRLVYEDGSHKTVLYAFELLAYSTGDQEKDADAYLSRSKSDVKYKLKNVKTDSLNATFFTPEIYESESDGLLLRSALILNPDNTLTVAQLYADTASFRQDNEYYFQLADKIIETLVSGNKPLKTEKRIENQGDLSIELNDGYYCYTESGPDFAVTYVDKLMPVDLLVPNIGIYRGGWPSVFIDSSSPDVTKETGALLDKTVEWMTQKSQDGYLTETVLEYNKGQKLHVFMSYSDTTDLKELNDMVKTIKLKAN